MRIIGIDFTSVPGRQKPITCLPCILEGGILRTEPMRPLVSFAEFESALAEPGPWICGIDFPFGLPRRFLENAGWPTDWRAYVEFALGLGKSGFVSALEAYKAPRKKGDKEHLRRTDRLVGSLSPQKLDRVPVAKMFFEGAPRLVRAGVCIPHVLEGDRSRIVVEAYPGALARNMVGRASYKGDRRDERANRRLKVRVEMFEKIVGDDLYDSFGFRVEAMRTIVEDPLGDCLDALLAAMQAAWAWGLRERGFGAPADVDTAEGWIAHPIVLAGTTRFA